MPSVNHSESNSTESIAEQVGHPKGTLAILIIYGLLFALGWIGLYFFEFLQRGALQP